MRKEEISRFNRAKSDAEFAKMLKIRTLGPEHLETQNQLRRDIRVCVYRSSIITGFSCDRMLPDHARSGATTGRPFAVVQEEVKRDEDWQAPC